MSKKQNLNQVIESLGELMVSLDSLINDEDLVTIDELIGDEELDDGVYEIMEVLSGDLEPGDDFNEVVMGGLEMIQDYVTEFQRQLIMFKKEKNKRNKK